jgi:glucose-6-phosphate isomerase
MSALTLRLGEHAQAVTDRVAMLRGEGFHTRLAHRDDSLWGDDPARRAVIANRLGWVDSPAAMLERAGEFRDFAAEVADAGFEHVLLLGMGGSSLAPADADRVASRSPCSTTPRRRRCARPRPPATRVARWCWWPPSPVARLR